MGIKESLEQPDEKDLKLQDFVIEEEPKQDELEFDIKKEISEERRQYIDNELASEKEKLESSYDYYIFLMHEKNLYDRNNYELGINEESWQILKNIILSEFKKHVELNGTPISFSGFRLQTLLTAKILFPNKISELPLSDYWQGRNGFVGIKNEIITSRWSFQFIRLCFAAKIIYPHEFDQLEIKQNEEIQKKEKEDIKVFYQSKQERMQSNFWLRLAERAAQEKIIFGKEIFHISKNDWKEMRKQLQLYYKEFIRSQKLSQTNQSMLHGFQEIPHFIELAMYLKILAAKEVRITDQGLELVMPEKKSHQQKTPPRPERREF